MCRTDESAAFHSKGLQISRISQTIDTKTRGPNGSDIAHLSILPQSIKVLQWMLYGVNLQIFMQSPTMAQMAHFSFPYYVTVLNSEFRILNSEFQNLHYEFRNSEL